MIGELIERVSESRDKDARMGGQDRGRGSFTTQGKN